MKDFLVLNWQSYSGETTMSYLTQMLGLTVQSSLSAATGMAVLAAMIRGFVRRSAVTIGNFWVDMSRSVLHILLPLSLVLAPVLVSQGAALRRSADTADGPIFNSGHLTVDRVRRIVTVSGSPIQLTPTEYGLLRTLVTHAGMVVTHRQLLREVCGVAYQDDSHILHVNVSNLRHKIEPDPTRPQFIVTEPGVGYRLRVDYRTPGNIVEDDRVVP